MLLPFEKITEICDEFLPLTDEMKQKLGIYADMLCEWNEKINLTAITDPEGIAVKHFLDSMMIFKYAEIPQGASVIDVGTGAGFPGVVMKIVRPDIKLTLLDSLAKRINFLNELCAALEIEVTTVHSRAEDVPKGLRESFDIATARAVANMRVLSEYCMPYVKVGGSFVALKGAAAEQELAETKNAIKVLGGELTSIKTFTLGDAGDRGVISIKKISQTPTKYPRVPAKISKQPL